MNLRPQFPISYYLHDSSSVGTVFGLLSTMNMQRKNDWTCENPPPPSRGRIPAGTHQSAIEELPGGYGKKGLMKPSAVSSGI